MKRAVRPRPTIILAIVTAAMLGGCSSSTPGTAGQAATTSAPVTSSSAAAASTAPSGVHTSAPASPPAGAAEPPSTIRTTQGPATSPEPPSQQPTQTRAGVLPTDLTGVVYGFVKAVDVPASDLTLDKVDWFSDAAAQQACDVDGVQQEARINGWCSIYYFRNVNPALRVVTVSPQVAVTTLDGNVQVAGDLTSLADRIATPTGSSRPYRITVTDGVVTEVVEVYQP